MSISSKKKTFKAFFVDGMAHHDVDGKNGFKFFFKLTRVNCTRYMKIMRLSPPSNQQLAYVAGLLSIKGK